MTEKQSHEHVLSVSVKTMLVFSLLLIVSGGAMIGMDHVMDSKDADLRNKRPRIFNRVGEYSGPKEAELDPVDIGALEEPKEGFIRNGVARVANRARNVRTRVVVFRSNAASRLGMHQRASQLRSRAYAIQSRKSCPQPSYPQPAYPQPTPSPSLPDQGPVPSPSPDSDGFIRPSESSEPDCEGGVCPEPVDFSVESAVEPAEEPAEIIESTESTIDSIREHSEEPVFPEGLIRESAMLMGSVSQFVNVACMMPEEESPSEVASIKKSIAAEEAKGQAVPVWPEEGNQEVVSLYTHSNWKDFPVEKKFIESCLSSDEFRQFVSGKQLIHYTDKDSLYSERFADYVTEFPELLIQWPNGGTYFALTDVGIPNSGEELVGMIYEARINDPILESEFIPLEDLEDLPVPAFTARIDHDNLALPDLSEQSVEGLVRYAKSAMSNMVYLVGFTFLLIVLVIMLPFVVLIYMVIRPKD